MWSHCDAPPSYLSKTRGRGEGGGGGGQPSMTQIDQRVVVSWVSFLRYVRLQVIMFVKSADRTLWRVQEMFRADLRPK